MEGLAATNVYDGGKGQNVKHHYAKNSIKLDPKKKGTFTSYCKSKGHEGVTSSCIKEGLASKNVLTRKRANFAKQAKLWNK